MRNNNTQDSGECYKTIKIENGDTIDIDAKKGTINVRLTKAQLSSRKKKWKAKKSSFGSGTLWKYAQTVGPALSLIHI